VVTLATAGSIEEQISITEKSRKAQQYQTQTLNQQGPTSIFWSEKMKALLLFPTGFHMVIDGVWSN